MAILDLTRTACARGAAFAGKWLLTIFVGVAAFALAAQALALVLAALALLLIALCLASLWMPEECRAVRVWIQETLCRWNSAAGADKTEEAQPSGEQPGTGGAAEPQSPGKDPERGITPQ